MASYSLPYRGPGYPDLTAVAAEANRGLAGLAGMQSAAWQAREASAMEAATNRREARKTELAVQSSFLDSARQERLDNIQAARNYAELERTTMQNKEAHLRVQQLQKARAEQEAREQYYSGLQAQNPAAAGAVQLFESTASPFLKLFSAHALASSPDVDISSLPARISEPLRTLVTESAEQRTYGIGGTHQVTLGQAFAGLKSGKPADRIQVAAIGRSLGANPQELRMAGLTDGEIKAAEKFSGLAGNSLDADAAAGLSRIRAIDAKINSLNKWRERDPSRFDPASETGAKNNAMLQDQIETLRVDRDALVEGSVGSETYDDLRRYWNGGLVLSRREQFSSFQNDLSAAIAKVSAQARMLPGPVANAVRGEIAEAGAAARVMQDSLDSDDPRAPLVAVQALLVNSSINRVFGMANMPGYTPQMFYTQRELGGPAAGRKANELNEAGAIEAKRAGAAFDNLYLADPSDDPRAPQVIDLEGAVPRANQLKKELAEWDDKASGNTPEDKQRKEKQLKEIQGALEATGLGFEEDGVFVETKEAVDAALASGTARPPGELFAAWVAESDAVTAGLPGGQAASKMAQNISGFTSAHIYQAALPATYRGLSVKPKNVSKSLSGTYRFASVYQHTIPGTRKTSARYADGWMPPGVEFAAQSANHAVQVSFLRRALDALPEAADQAAAEGSPQDSPMRKAQVTKFAKNLKEAVAARDWLVGELEGAENPRMMADVRLSLAANPDARDRMWKPLTWVFTDGSTQASKLREELKRELGSSYSSVIEYLGFQVTEDGSVVGAGGGVRSIAPMLGIEEPQPKKAPAGKATEGNPFVFG